MDKGKRGELILTLTGVNMTTVKQGLYEREFWTYDFRSDDNDAFRYGGQRYALFVGKRYRVTATSDGYRYGATHLKRPRFSGIADRQNELFER
jgi:hypothetical protein